MKLSRYLKTPLIILAIFGASTAISSELEFDFTAEAFESGDTLSFTSGNYTMTATPSVGGQSAKIAKGGSGLGVSLPAVFPEDDPATEVDESATPTIPADWPMENGDSVTLSLTLGTIPIPFSEIQFTTASIASGSFWSQNERATLTIGENSFIVKGNPQAGSESDLNINGAENFPQSGSDWSGESASTVNLSAAAAFNRADDPSTPDVDETIDVVTSFRITGMIVEINPDLDGDTVNNDSDICPTVANTDQLDTDGDSIGDACDDDPDGDGTYNLRFNFVPESIDDNQFGKDSIAFTTPSGNFTMTVTGSLDGAPVKVATTRSGPNAEGVIPDNPLLGLGVSVPSIEDDPATTEVDESVPANWTIKVGEGLTGTLTNSSGQAVDFGNLTLYPSAGGQMTTSDRANLLFGGDDYVIKGNAFCSENCGDDELRIDHFNKLYCHDPDDDTTWGGNPFDPAKDCSGATSFSSNTGSSFYLVGETAWNAADGSTDNTTGYRIAEMSMSFSDDTDADGVSVTIDNCPSVSNLDQADADNDGTGDACDNDPDGDGIETYTFDFANDGNQFGVQSLTFPSSKGDLTVEVTSGDAFTVVAKQLANGIGVKNENEVDNQKWMMRQTIPLEDSNGTPVTNGGQSVYNSAVFTFRDSNGLLVDVTNLTFVAPQFHGGRRALLQVPGFQADIQGGANTVDTNGNGSLNAPLITAATNTVDGSTPWSNFESYVYTISPVDTVEYGSGMRIASLTVDINTNDTTTDTDADTVPDFEDNCPNDANTDQSDIDSDTIGDACDDDIDNDGVLNAGDAFPTDGNETTDSDLDGVGDNSDICPNNSDVGQADNDSDGQGDACDTDIDGDGVLNDIETALGFDPADPSDGTAAAAAALEAINNGGGSDEAVSVPAMGIFGLIALALSMLGLGVFQVRRR